MSFETGFIGFIQLFEMNEGETPPPGGDEIPDGELPEGAGELLLSPGSALFLYPEIEIEAPEVVKVGLTHGGLVLFSDLDCGIEATVTTLRPNPGLVMVQGSATPMDVVQLSAGQIIYTSPGITLIEGYNLDESTILYDAPVPVIEADLTIAHPEPGMLLVQSKNIYIRIADAIIIEVIKEESLSETVMIWDQADKQIGFPVSESMAMADSVEVKLLLLVDEYISIRDTLTGQWNGNLSLSESLYMVDTASWVRVLYETISEAMAIADSATPELCLLVSDYILVREAVTGNAVFNNEATETIAMTDTLVSGFVLDLLESLAIADAVTLIKSVNETIDETMAFSDVLSALGVFNLSLSEAATAIDTVSAGYSIYLSESVGMTDTVTSFSEMFLTLSESMSAVDALTVSIETCLSLSENLYIIDSVSSLGTFYLTVQEGFHLNLTIELDGEVYECWVLNTPGFYPSVYSGFNFNSYCVFDGRAFGANATGIFELTGDTDAGAEIHTGIMTHSTDFGTRNGKRFRKAYVGVSGDAPVMVMETETGERCAYSISSAGKVDATSSLSGKEWSLSVVDFESVDAIELVPVVLARRN